MVALVRVMDSESEESHLTSARTQKVFEKRSPEILRSASGLVVLAPYVHFPTNTLLSCALSNCDLRLVNSNF